MNSEVHPFFVQADHSNVQGWIYVKYTRDKNGSNSIFMGNHPCNILPTKPENIKHALESNHLSVLKSIAYILDRRNIEGQVF